MVQPKQQILQQSLQPKQQILQQSLVQSLLQSLSQKQETNHYKYFVFEKKKQN